MIAHVHCLLVPRYGLWWLGIRSESRKPHVGVYLSRSAALRAVDRHVAKIG